jgi:hypothetical protein
VGASLVGRTLMAGLGAPVVGAQTWSPPDSDESATVPLAGGLQVLQPGIFGRLESQGFAVEIADNGDSARTFSRECAVKEGPMFGPARFDRIASGLAAAVTLVMGPTSETWGQGPASVGPASPAPAASGSAATSNVSAALTLVFLGAVVMSVIVVVARYVVTRRKRLEEAAILQARLSDAIDRETPMRGLVITPKARIPAWRGSPLTIEVAGEVPTPELRDTVMRLVRTEASRERPDVIIEDHLFIDPRMHRAS